MSNFFRDSSLGFKTRPNLFAKLRVPETKQHDDAPMDISLIEGESDSSLITMFDKNDSNNANNKNNNNMTNNNEIEDDTTSQTMMNDMKPHMGASTPKGKSKDQLINRINLDDDFEITEVREITPPNQQISLHKPQGELLKTPSKIKFHNLEQFNSHGSMASKDNQNHNHTRTHSNNFNIEPNSNDVLLEAFTNTQKICSNLKQEIQMQRNENSKLKSILKNYQVDVKKINEKIDNYRTLLNNLQETSAAFLKQKSINEENVTKLTKNQANYSQKIQNFSEEITTLRSNFNRVNDLKREMSTELLKKDKEIEYLKRELDDCSGQLSEEKIKNSSLINEMNQMKEELLDYLKEKLPENESNVMNLISTLETKLINVFDNQLKDNSAQNNEIIKLEIIKQLQFLQQRYL